MRGSKSQLSTPALDKIGHPAGWRGHYSINANVEFVIERCCLSFKESDFAPFAFLEHCGLKRFPASAPKYHILQRQYFVRKVNQALEGHERILFDEQMGGSQKRLSELPKTEEKAAGRIKAVKVVQSGESRP